MGVSPVCIRGPRVSPSGLITVLMADGLSPMSREDTEPWSNGAGLGGRRDVNMMLGRDLSSIG